MERVNDYLNFLQEVYESTKKEGRTPVTMIAKKYGIHSQVSIIMIENKLIKNVGFASYSWTTIVPNIKMAEKLKELTDKWLLNYNNGRVVAKTKVKKKKSAPYVHLEPEKKQEKPKTRKKSWSILWGLYTKYK